MGNPEFFRQWYPNPERGAAGQFSSKPHGNEKHLFGPRRDLLFPPKSANEIGCVEIGCVFCVYIEIDLLIFPDLGMF